jgi:RNA polymerase sigma-70 factor (ECF subfamily)
MSVTSPSALREPELLAAARGGDESAFRTIVERHRPTLHAHCYRMLGSLHDADDALQETLLRAWTGLRRFGGRSTLGTWLYRIATNVCLDAIARRPKRILPPVHGRASAPATFEPGEPLVESVWLEPYPHETLGLEDGYASPDARYEQREAVELAFVAALQHLPATQRAVLIMREVLGYSALEAASLLDTTVPSVNSALQRARKTLADRLPDRSQQASLRALGDDGVRSLVDAYVDALARGDVESITALVTEDAVFSMPPWPIWWRGRDSFRHLARHAVEACPDSRRLWTTANGQPALGSYTRVGESDRFAAAAIDVFTFEGSLIKEVTAFVTPEIFARFGLPAEL